VIIDTLKVFITVIEEKNFSRAAENLFISQPSVSLHIRNLENELGTKLLYRTSKYVEPTQAGLILYEKAKSILNLYEEAKQDINLLKNIVTGSLKIGASFTIGEYILPNLLAEFSIQYPKVDLEVTIANTEEIAQKVHAKQLDIGLIEGQSNYGNLNTQVFNDDEMILVVPNNHPLARLDIVTADDLQDQTWIFRENGSGTRSFSDQLISDLGLRVKRSFVFGSSQGVKQAVIAGLGISLVSCLIVRKELNADELTAMRIKGKRLFRPLLLLQAKEPIHSKAIAILKEKLLTSSSDMNPLT